jgi:hypothetical protein
MGCLRPGTVAFEMIEWELHIGRLLALRMLENIQVLRHDPALWNLTWEQQAKRVLEICEKQYADMQAQQLEVSQLPPDEIRKRTRGVMHETETLR